VPLTRTEWLTAASCLAIGTFALATWVMIGFLGQGISHEASYVVAQPFVPLGHTNLTAMIEPVFILGISFYFLLPSKRARQALALALLFLFATIDFSWSRSAFITSSLTLALFIFLSRPNTRKQVIFLLLPVVLIPMGTRKAYEIIHENYFRDRSHYDPNDPSTRTVSSMFRLLNPYSEEDQTSMAERIQRWKIGWNMFLQRPFTGIGPGCFADLHYDNLMQGRTPQQGTATKIAKRKMNLHNGYLSWIVEGGLPWALAGLWLCIQILRHLFRLGKATAGLSRWGHPLRIGLLLYFVHFFVQAIFQDFSHEPRVIILFWIGTALVTSVQPRATSES
jgi:putative inorganic carbon (hco3(-)) transporter